MFNEFVDNFIKYHATTFTVCFNKSICGWHEQGSEWFSCGLTIYAVQKLIKPWEFKNHKVCGDSYFAFVGLELRA
jgi:hypothetical protein